MFEALRLVFMCKNRLTFQKSVQEYKAGSDPNIPSEVCILGPNQEPQLAGNVFPYSKTAPMKSNKTVLTVSKARSVALKALKFLIWNRSQITSAMISSN